MPHDPPPSLDRLLELRDEIIETLRGAKPGSDAVLALDAQLTSIDEQIAASEGSASN